MAMPYATLGDLKSHWSALPADQEADAQQKLVEASLEVRGNYPELDRRITVAVEDGGMDPDIPRLVVCRMVKRSMDVSEDAPAAGFESIQFGTGPFSMGGKVLNPDGNLYLTAADKRLLGKSKPRKQAWTIHPGG
jgi:hypothetical protein